MKTNAILVLGRRIALAVSLTLILASARGQTMPRSLMAVPGDGQVTLTWDAAGVVVWRAASFEEIAKEEKEDVR